MTLVQHESPTRGTDMAALLDLCTAQILARQELIRRQDREADAEAVELAATHAVSVFGADAAATFGPWSPSPMMDEDCLQAVVMLAPGAYLQFTAHCENGQWFTLLSSCARCGTSSETRVARLLGLAEALTAAGVH